nr:nucleotidyltransferase domain-containing protein [Kineococcus siccus]
MTEQTLQALADRLCDVSGVLGVALGGSRARGTATAESDYDVGVYYRRPLDVAGVQRVAEEFAGAPTRASPTGAWGPWVDGGAWISVEGSKVDLIYRELERVDDAWSDAGAGLSSFHTQVGHPLGFPKFAYAGELALSQVLCDPAGFLRRRHQDMATPPAPLRLALVTGLWEAEFLLGAVGSAAARGDAAYVAGVLFRVVGVCAHALHGHAGRWLVTDKGMVAAAGALPGAPAGFTERAHALLGGPGTAPDELRAAVASAVRLVDDVVAACTR